MFRYHPPSKTGFSSSEWFWHAWARHKSWEPTNFIFTPSFHSSSPFFPYFPFPLFSLRVPVPHISTIQLTSLDVLVVQRHIEGRCQSKRPIYNQPRSADHQLSAQKPPPLRNKGIVRERMVITLLSRLSGFIKAQDWKSQFVSTGQLAPTQHTVCTITHRL